MPLSWAVATSGYELKDEEGVLYIRPSAPVSQWREYQPEQKPRLYRAFGRIQTAQDCLNFANEYGMLRQPLRQLAGDNAGLATAKPEKVEFWLLQAQRVREVQSAWEIVENAAAATQLERQRAEAEQELRHLEKKTRICNPEVLTDLLAAFFTNDKEMLAKLLSEVELPGTIFEALKHLEKRRLVAAHLKELKQMSPEQLEQGLRDLVCLRVYDALRHSVHPVLQQVGGRMELIFGPVNLLGVIWLQVAQEIAGIRQRRICQHCGEGFWLYERGDGRSRTRKDIMYCSRACKQAAYRKRKAEASLSTAR